MNRKSFMAELRSLLAFLDAAERERVLNRYERMFDEAGAEGEAAVIRCFGSPVRQVLQIEREYREAVASGETPFADGDAAAVPAETEAPEETEIIEEEYAETELVSVEAAPETEEPMPEETVEEPEILTEEPVETVPEAPVAAAPESPAYAVLPELDLDDLDFSDLGLTFPKKTETPAAPVEEEPAGEPKEPAESEESAFEEPESVSEETPETKPAEDAFLAALLAEAETAEALLEPEADEPAKPAAEEAVTEPEKSAPADVMPEKEPETEEKTETAETADASETPEEPETADEAALTYDIPAEELPAEDAEIPPEETPAVESTREDTEEEYEYEEAEERRPVSGGRAFAAVMVTIPMLAVWALLFGLSLGLGVAVLAIGAALVAVGVYLTGYVFNGAIVRMPDLLLTAGAALGVFALALLLLWSGVSIAVAGCTLTVRLTRCIYRSILYPKKEENGDE